MSGVEILPDFFFIRRGFLNSNHFVYRDREPILVDTAYLADYSETERLISELGVDLARTRRIISTHCHCDHIGGNRIIQDRSGCEIAMHRIGKHFIDNRDAWATWWSYFVQEAEFFHCTTALDAGELVNIGPYEFEVIYTPGHSADGIVLYNREERLLLSSDTLWDHDMAVMTIRVEGSRAVFSMLESLARIESLDVRTVCPGHGDIFTDYRAALKRAKARLERFIKHPSQVGTDVLKKIIVYTLMMKRGFDEAAFLPYLITAPWFRETIDHYFHGDHESVFKEIMTGLIKKGVVVRSNGRIDTTVER